MQFNNFPLCTIISIINANFYKSIEKYNISRYHIYQNIF